MNRFPDDPVLQQFEKIEYVRLGNARIALTTDSYVVNPIFFEGGDIGEPTVNGTVNDSSVQTRVNRSAIV